MSPGRQILYQRQFHLGIHHHPPPAPPARPAAEIQSSQTKPHTEYHENVSSPERSSVSSQSHTPGRRRLLLLHLSPLPPPPPPPNLHIIIDWWKTFCVCARPPTATLLPRSLCSSPAHSVCKRNDTGPPVPPPTNQSRGLTAMPGLSGAFGDGSMTTAMPVMRLCVRGV